MARYIKTIKLDNTLSDIFFSYLLAQKFRVPSLSQEQKNLVIDISNLFLMAGFLLNSCVFTPLDNSLIKKLKHQKEAQLVKQMLMINDLRKIAHRFTTDNLEFAVLKGLALYVDGVYQSGLRPSRDIDLLVREESLGKAYKVLKSLGFRYRNPLTKDSVDSSHGHHLPELINENNTIIELHWRATHAKDFQNCPLTEMMLKKRRISKTCPYIYCPPIELTLAHIVHHGLITHQMDLGPLFLFDLAAIFAHSGNQWPVNRDLLEDLEISPQFAVCQELVEQLRIEDKFSEESRLLINQIFDESLWLQIKAESTELGLQVKYIRIENKEKDDLLGEFIRRLQIIKHAYQVSYFSFRFYVLLSYHGFRFLKQVVRNYFG